MYSVGCLVISPDRKEDMTMDEQNLKQMSFVAACRQFFGLLPNQTLMEFANELRQLTPNDKAELIQLFRTIGIDATKQS
jgi:hypothetical protein